MLKKMVLIHLSILGLSIAFHNTANANITNIIEEDPSCPTAMIMAIINNDRSSLETYLNYHVDPNTDLSGCEGNKVYDAYPKSSTLLHIAAYSAPVTLESLLAKNSSYHLLIDYGAYPNVANEKDNTPSDIRSCITLWGRGPCWHSSEVQAPHKLPQIFRIPI